MAEAYQYPPELLELLVEALARLNKGKKGVVGFLRGAGVDVADLSEVEQIVRTNPDSISKFEIARNVLERVNARGDSGIRARREIIKRVEEFEDFSSCWPEDQMKARGLVAAIREARNKKDSFTRMQQERDAERARNQARQQAERDAAAEKRSQLDAISGRLSALFAMDDAPQRRGKLLEGVLNDLFRAFGIHVEEDFRRRNPDTGVVVEQIDGVIELDSHLYLVEMKWLREPAGIGEFMPHLGRVFLRGDARGILISSNGFTEAVTKECAAALTQKTLILCSLREIIMLLHRQDDLAALLKTKVHAAVIGKNPYHQILS
ncbi:restriction endonuclease [Burkholderia gladioli]|uniref:restriction endonuclease n=1 Tax=Burkholderia gladioli TaxID=28095 RepID=UPI0016404CCC|nr:restriction endonuclease [Burkholderia gladioli]